MDNDIEEYINQQQAQIEDLQSKNVHLQTAVASGSYGKENNAVEYQLETNELLADIKHDLRGDYIEINQEGQESWVAQTDLKLRVLNDYGVNTIMSRIRKYISKHTVLSNYSEERIYEILADIGDDLRITIFSKAEKMGMDDEYKKSEYVGLVIGVLHTIESAYRRAIRGKTSEDINNTNIFTQTDNGNRNMPMQKQRFNLLSPKTWGR